MRIVVTGANRGLGLELVSQLAARETIVEATARQPHQADELNALAAFFAGRIHVHACDVSQDKSVAAFAARLAGAPVDALINNAGALPVRDATDHIEPGDELLKTLNVNAVGPLRVTQALLPNLRAGAGRRIIHISSLLGSITDTVDGDSVGYRMSKAALNMLSRVLANGLRADGIASLVVHPGWVRTRMGGPRATLPTSESAAGIIALLDKLTVRQSGSFVDYRGRALRW
jgi:NAD(P)-dependent dehydrogenase (short-subunit alcohol dehydrogenase family)